MKLAEIIENLTSLTSSIREDEFIYDFLNCFGTPKATIARLKSGGVNLAKKPGCALLKTKIYFEPIRPDGRKTGTPSVAIEMAKKDRQITANKPRFLIATNFKTLSAYDTKKKEALEIPIAELHDHCTFFLPLAGMEKTVAHIEAEADVKAAENMAKLHDLIRADNPPKTREERHALNVFLTRLLFCYFAEDTGIFPEKSFTNAVASYTQVDGSDLADFLRQLFITLNADDRARTGTPKHLDEFPYVNGGLFRDTDARCSAVPHFSAKSRQKLIELGSKGWKDINPDIFGSMFQGVVDDEKRAELGMHYTSVPNIMKVIRPLFLDDLSDEFEKAKGSEPKLNKLLKRIYSLRIFDPACGSGNFLIIAYKELRRLETAIFSELQALTSHLPFPGIHVSQFYGIEIDDFAHEIAILALWLAEHQMNVEFNATFGRAPASLPLKEGANIFCGNAIQRSWSEVCPADPGVEIHVLGNPPYLGARQQSQEQKADVRHVALNIHGHGNLDYVSCFLLKGAQYVRDTGAQIAFVSTNSIGQGEQVAILWPHVLSSGVEIGFVCQAFKWSNSAKANAAVTCVIVGLRQVSTRPKYIFHGGLRRQATMISPYFVEGKTVYVLARRAPISRLPPINYGSFALDDGNFTLTQTDIDAAISAGRPGDIRYFRKFLGAKEFIQGQQRYCLWLEDAEVGGARENPDIARRIEHVRKWRSESDRATTVRLSETPHRFAEIRQPKGPYFVFPTVSSERREYIPVGLLDSSTVASNQLYIIPDAQEWAFAVISSKVHMVWVRAVAGRLEDRIRYSSSICYNNFPFPNIGLAKKKQLDFCAEVVLTTREKYPQNTISQLYDPDKMPADLLSAHRELDTAVEQCYRAKPFTSDEERLEYLFVLYEKMSAA